MTDFNYSHLRVLVADDFSNFRTTINGMLGRLGIALIDSASNGADVLAACQEKRFDVILCDYDLGPGRNGQQVLEALRHHKLISRRVVFIVISAEAAKDMVMAAYDCEPDDYLMKPINASVLGQRISRLLAQREALTPIYEALDSQDLGRAVALLIDLSRTEGRYALVAQKRLGEIFIAAGELDKAERLYIQVLQSRQLDWARLGLATVKQLQGELQLAGSWLEKIVKENPLFLPAYDVLASNWEKQGQDSQVQEIIQRSVDISPKSILRHKRLAEVAERNGEILLALKSLRTTMILGELSCHASQEDNLNFARVASSCIEKNMLPVEPLFYEAVDAVHAARAKFALSPIQALRADLLEGRALAIGGLKDRASKLIAAAEEATKTVQSRPLEVELDRVSAQWALGQRAQGESLLQRLADTFAGDQQALQRLDGLLIEPLSERSRAMVASVNRAAIALYNERQFDQAIAQFMTVTRRFPRHVGVQLNIMQSLVGKLKSGTRDSHTVQQTRHAIATIGTLIEPGHSQYGRFQRLRSMATANFDE